MKKIILAALIVATFASCEKRIDYTCVDKVFDEDLNLIYVSEPYHKQMTDKEWNMYINEKRTKTTSTGCCKPKRK